MAEAEFKGIRQYTKEKFDAISDAEKKGCISFVRDLDASGTTIDTHIYLGTRDYASNDIFYEGDDAE